MPIRITKVIANYRELSLVLLAALIGLLAHTPLRWLGARHGIDVMLVILVFSSAVTVSAGAFDRLRSSTGRIVLTLLVGATLLPALSWAASHVVTAGPLRLGIMALGLAPCEIASIAATGIAGGEPVIAAAVLVGSTAVSVALAGPVLALEVGHAGVDPGQIVVNLLIVVALPLAAGFAVRLVRPPGPRGEQVAQVVSTGALAALVALVAAQIEPSRSYAGVLAAVLVFLAGSIVVGAVLGRGAAPDQAVPILLTVSMRDFAIAAALATSAFGAAAAAPLGLYGVLVIVWGTAVGGTLRRRATDALPPMQSGSD